MIRRLSLLFALAAVAVVCGAVLWAGRHRAMHVVDRVEELSGIATAAADPPAAPAGREGTLNVRLAPPIAHPRILLTPPRLAALRRLRDSGAPSWTLLLEQCRETRDHNIEPGYEAWDWGHAALALALCANATNDPSYASAGVRYYKALLDDKAKVGDGAGGDAIVRHDDGYSIRTHGVLGAIAYDWLHDAPGMTPDLRKRGMDRTLAWIRWFKEKGYEHDQPISNYYVSYFGTIGLGGIAFEKDDPRADSLRQQTQQMWNHEVVPVYGTKLAGGDYSEGWQYGDLVGMTLAIFADAESNAHPSPSGASGAPHPSLFDDLPWLRAAVSARAFALHPDGKHTYDNGDWSQNPPVAPLHTLEALSIVLPSSDLAGRQATFLARIARLANKDEKEDFSWLRALADDPTRAAEDPRKGTASYLAPGTATVFARSSYSPTAIWGSLTFEPSLSPHEHRDCGHFEIVRGSDRLFIDSGSYESFSSFAHNVVLIDDPLQSSDYDTSIAHRDIITYKSVQGGWNYDSHVARYEDGGGYVYALGTYDSAFNPIGFPDERKDRAVLRAEREWVFSRTPVAGAGGSPGAGAGETGRVVIYDRFTFNDSRYVATFILHGGLAPQITGPLARFTTGRSSGWVTTLLPKGSVSSVADETHNTPSNDRVFFTNVPPEGVTSFRYQVAYPPGGAQGAERRFLHAIVIGSAGTTLPAGSAPVAIEGAQVAGAAIDGEAYVFSSAGPARLAVPLAYRAPATATKHLVFDLSPSAQYAVSSVSDGDGCKITLTPGSGKIASPKGVLALDVAACAVR